MRHSLASSLVKSNNYEFTFEYSDDEPYYDIKSIFANCQLINIEYIAETDLDRIHDKNHN